MAVRFDSYLAYSYQYLEPEGRAKTLRAKLARQGPRSIGDHERHFRAFVTLRESIVRDKAKAQAILPS